MDLLQSFKTGEVPQSCRVTFPLRIISLGQSPQRRVVRVSCRWFRIRGPSFSPSSILIRSWSCKQFSVSSGLPLLFFEASASHSIQTSVPPRPFELQVQGLWPFGGPSSPPVLFGALLVIRGITLVPSFQRVWGAFLASKSTRSSPPSVKGSLFSQPFSLLGLP